MRRRAEMLIDFLFYVLPALGLGWLLWLGVKCYREPGRKGGGAGGCDGGYF